jgi:putative ABC transport system permease protein
MRRLLAFLPYVARTIVRAWTRTSLTVLGAALAMALFAFVRTVDRGVKELEARASKPLLVVFQDSRFCPLTSNLPVRYAPAIREVEGVDRVLPTLVFINSCRANLDLVTLHGVEAENLDRVYELKLVQGDVARFKATANGALVGERLAARRMAEVDASLVLGNVNVKVSGIFRSDVAGLDNLAFVHLDQLALAQKKLGGATQFLVTLKPGAQAEEVARAIDEKFAADEARTDTKGMQAFVSGAVGEIVEVVEFARILGYIAVAIVALVLANTVYISAQSRAAEMGVLETIGLTKPRLAGLISLEGIGLGLLGGALGAGAVLLYFAISPTTLGIEGYGIDFTPSAAVAAQTLLASFAIGALASVGPAVEAVLRPLHSAVTAE